VDVDKTGSESHPVTGIDNREAEPPGSTVMVLVTYNNKIYSTKQIQFSCYY
jgi:hypothetical protein